MDISVNEHLKILKETQDKLDRAIVLLNECYILLVMGNHSSFKFDKEMKKFLNSVKK